MDAMTSEKWKKFARYIVSKGGIFECILSGGEPLLLGEDLFDIMEILHDDGTCFLLITNGFLLSKEKVKRLRKYRYRWLQISIDGADPNYHDSFRQRDRCWKNAVEGAFMVSSEGIPLTIAHCVTPYFIYQRMDGKKSIHDLWIDLQEEYNLSDIDEHMVKRDFVEIIRDLQWQKNIRLKEA